jgi:hypothetical protein
MFPSVYSCLRDTGPRRGASLSHLRKRSLNRVDSVELDPAAPPHPLAPTMTAPPPPDIFTGDTNHTGLLNEFIPAGRPLTFSS